MLKQFIFFTIFTLSLSLLPAQQSFAASSIGRVVHAYGDTWIERGKQLDKLAKGQVVLRNDSIITGKRGRVKVVMSDGSKVYVGARSRVSLRQYTMKKNKLFSATINMLWGKARFFVNKLTAKGSSFKVNTPTAVLGVRGTEFIVSVPPTAALLKKALNNNLTLNDIPPLPTRTALIEGAIQVSSGIGKPVLLRPGNTADISASKKIRTFKTSSDDIDKHEQDVMPNSPKKSDGKDKSKHETSENEDNATFTPPAPQSNTSKPDKGNENKRPKPRNHAPKPDLRDTTNAIQNLNNTTNVTIEAGFVRP